MSEKLTDKELEAVMNITFGICFTPEISKSGTNTPLYRMKCDRLRMHLLNKAAIARRVVEENKEKEV